MKFPKFLIISFFTEHLWWLPLGNGIQNGSIRLDSKLLKLLQ